MFSAVFAVAVVPLLVLASVTVSFTPCATHVWRLAKCRRRKVRRKVWINVNLTSWLGLHVKQPEAVYSATAHVLPEFWPHSNLQALPSHSQRSAAFRDSESVKASVSEYIIIHGVQ